MSSEDSGQFNEYKHFWSELKRRTFQPFKNLTFVFYVFAAIIVLGCLGIWVALFKFAQVPDSGNRAQVLTAIATFFPALVGSSSLQLMLASAGNNDKLFVVFSYVVSLLAAFAVVLVSSLHAEYPYLSLWIAIAFSIIAVWLWCFTNGDDPTYKSAAVDAASGGDTNRPLKGDTTGFQG